MGCGSSKTSVREEAAPEHALVQAAAVLVEGHPRSDCDFNGVYYKDFQHKQLPVFKKEENGYCLYHFEAKSAWRLGGVHRPDEDLCVSHIASPDGCLPTSTQTWLSSAGAGPAPSPEHKFVEFSVTLLVCISPRDFRL